MSTVAYRDLQVRHWTSSEVIVSRLVLKLVTIYSFYFIFGRSQWSVVMRGGGSIVMVVMGIDETAVSLFWTREPTINRTFSFYFEKTKSEQSSGHHSVSFWTLTGQFNGRPP